ncbi:hypothetical protein Tco_0341320 [Tanacetum coccineum]
MMNEMVRNQLEVATMQVNVQFLQQLQPEWSIFVTVVKQIIELDKESYHKLFDILKQYKKEVNEIYAEKIARNANPLALVAAAQQYPDLYYQAPKSYKSYVPPSKQASSTISHATTKHKGKAIAKPITPPSKSASEEDSDPKQAQIDKDINKNVDTTLRYMNENQTGQFGSQRTVTVAGAREIECRKPKRAKDYTYYKEKMLLCKQAGKGVPLQADQSDWLEDTDEEIDDKELEAHSSFMAKIQEVLPVDLGSDAEPLEKVQYDADYNVFANERQHSEQPESINDTYVVEKVDSNVIPDSSGMCDNDNRADQNTKECDDERAMLANLITILKLDTKENKKIQKQLKKANASLAQALKECKSILEEANRTLGESNRTRDRYLGELHDKEVELAKYKTCKDRTIENDILEIKECECLTKKLSKQTENVSKEVYNELSRSFAKLEKHSISLELGLQQCQEQITNDTVCKEKASTVFLKEREQYFEIQDLKTQLEDKNIAISELKKLIEKFKEKYVETKFDKPSFDRQPNAQRIPKPSVLGKLAPFSDSLERKRLKTTKSVTKTNVSKGLSKPVARQILP